MIQMRVTRGMMVTQRGLDFRMKDLVSMQDLKVQLGKDMWGGILVLDRLLVCVWNATQGGLAE